MPRPSDFDLNISRQRLNEIAPALLDELREYVAYGLCRQGNAAERRALAEKFAALAEDTLQKFPDLKLHHMRAKTTVEEGDADATQD